MKVVASIFEGVIAYVIVDYLMDAMITGTSTGESIMLTLVPIGIAVGVVGASLGIGSLLNRGGQ